MKLAAAPVADAEPLVGFTVAVTTDRRHDELPDLLERCGARVVVAPALRIVPLPDDSDLRAATVTCIDRPLDLLVATTAIGLRGWLEAAEGWGLADPLRARLASATLVARGPQTHAAIRAAGLADSWAPGVDSTDAVLDHLLARGIAGQRIAVQLHGEPQPDFCAALRAAGADVLEIPVYRWGPPTDPAPLRRLVDLIGGRLVDAVTFTSAPAVRSLIDAGGPAVLDRMRTGVTAACVGELAAEPLITERVPVVAPDQPRLSGLVHRLVEELPKRAPTLRVAGTTVTLRGHAAVVNGLLKPLAPGPMAVLRALAEARGKVLSRAALLRVLPRGADEHAVEMAVARLRAALGGTTYVQTVVKRGYRLALD
jgi:uroporphyrinogen-III synthase